MGNSSGNIAGPQLLQCNARREVTLAHVLLQHVHRPAVAGDQGLEAAARAHRPQLAVVAHHHHLGPGIAGGLQQPQQGRVLGHGRLIQDDHVAVAEGQLAVVETPGEGGQSAGGFDARGVAQGAGRLARGRAADDFEALGLEGVGHRGQGGGLSAASVAGGSTFCAGPSTWPKHSRTRPVACTSDQRRATSAGRCGSRDSCATFSAHTWPPGRTAPRTWSSCRPEVTRCVTTRSTAGSSSRRWSPPDFRAPCVFTTSGIPVLPSSSPRARTLGR